MEGEIFYIKYINNFCFLKKKKIPWRLHRLLEERKKKKLNYFLLLCCVFQMQDLFTYLSVKKLHISERIKNGYLLF